MKRVIIAPDSFKESLASHLYALSVRRYEKTREQ